MSNAIYCFGAVVCIGDVLLSIGNIDPNEANSNLQLILAAVIAASER